MRNIVDDRHFECDCKCEQENTLLRFSLCIQQQHRGNKWKKSFNIDDDNGNFWHSSNEKTYQALS